MRTKRSGRARGVSYAVLGCMGLGLAQVPAGAQEARLGSIAPYLMDRDEEIALARSAAPFELGRAADVWVLTASGYERAQAGTNGFACFVGRGWSGPILIGSGERRRMHPDVFNPEVRAPHCFNALAAASVLPWHVARTAALLQGTPAEEVDARMVGLLERGALSVPPGGAMAYMTSSHQHLGTGFGPWRPHVMIYLADLDNEGWGIPGFTNEFPFVAEAGTPWSVAVVPMQMFSDGTRPRAATGGGNGG